MSGLTHLDEHGRAHMVDVGSKPVTARRAVATGRTGVEMEAMTAVAVACLTVYDMVKAVDRGMTIEQVRLLEKTGGTRGDWSRPETAGNP